MRLALLAALTLGACSPVAVQQTGQQTGPHHPTIVSLNPCTDAILAEVADPQQIIALSHYSQSAQSSSMDVAQARRFAFTGGTVEEVLALRPDLVISGNFMSPPTVAAFERLGMKLVQVPIARTVPETIAQVRQLAALARQRGRGEALVAQMEKSLAKAATSDTPLTSLIWQSGGIVPGDDSLIADLLRRTGFINFSGAKGMGQADYLPLETVLADPPQVIFATGDARSQEDRMLAHPALVQMKGIRREPLDSALLWCGGPTIIRAAERLAEVRSSL